LQSLRAEPSSIRVPGIGDLHNESMGWARLARNPSDRAKEGRPPGHFFRYYCSPPETTFRPDRPPASGTFTGRFREQVRNRINVGPSQARLVNIAVAPVWTRIMSQNTPDLIRAVLASHERSSRDTMIDS